MTIRPFAISDLKDCVSVFRSAYNILPWNYNWEATKAERYLTEYIGGVNFHGVVICENDTIVGGMFGHVKTWWTGDQLYIDELFIASESQGKGCGKMIMDHCESYCKENKLEMVTLMTNKFMPSYNFYLNNDYIPVSQFVFMFKQM